MNLRLCCFFIEQLAIRYHVMHRNKIPLAQNILHQLRIFKCNLHNWYLLCMMNTNQVASIVVLFKSFKTLMFYHI